MRKGFQWSKTDSQTLMHLRSGVVPEPWHKIAALIGTNVDSCKNKMKRIVAGVDSPHDGPEPVQRTCGLCSRPFVADGRYIRTCGPCKATSVFSVDNGDFAMVGY